MTLYYHVGPAGHAVGHVINPTFGAIYKTYDPRIHCDPANWLMLSRELIFENVRLRKFPEKPSRFDGAFACPTEADLNAYMQTVSKPYYLQRYEVELVDPTQPVHLGDHSICYWRQGAVYDDVERIADDYWAGNHARNEILTASPLRVVKAI